MVGQTYQLLSLINSDCESSSIRHSRNTVTIAFADTHDVERVKQQAVPATHVSDVGMFGCGCGNKELILILTSWWQAVHHTHR